MHDTILKFCLMMILLIFLSLIALEVTKEKNCDQKIQPIVVEYELKYPETFRKNVVITAYTNCPTETNQDDFTALMEKPVSGWTVAVSRDLMQFLGMKVYIEGYGVRYVNDLMNKRFTNSIDIYVGTKEEARNIGRTEAKAVFYK